jgi:hypothetical protein
MTKQPGPQPQPVTVHTIHLNGNELVYVGQAERPPHLVTLTSRTAIEALQQRYAVYVDDVTLERVREALAAQGVTV